ncbi:Myb-like_DNA-binding domain-containing protein [Hexamita inflata]|uniref:Myb-like DNA-binding domain-containing protein n=1 Tax=Hexamita inflata TaxID=28002 RepID=A0AA86QSI3_9EUKA|nr:Myb-like DNA-binding domain-containing protein [Hexamita inflata]CAI9963233.1 Myb-like DNA-binding domain-containing protein [Hexamita inflata]
MANNLQQVYSFEQSVSDFYIIDQFESNIFFQKYIKEKMTIKPECEGNVRSQISSTPINSQKLTITAQLILKNNICEEKEESSFDDYKGEIVQRASAIPWLPDEDRYLIKLVHLYSCKNWQNISNDMSQRFPRRSKRSSNQCNQRWMRVLNPEIQKGKWDNEQDQKLLEVLKISEVKKWKMIADLIPGRTDIQVRYRVKKIGEWLVRNGAHKSYLF